MKKQLNWQTQPPLEHTVIRIDPIDGKFHIGKAVASKYTKSFTGVIQLMWNPDWACVRWDTNNHENWVRTEFLT